MIKAITFDLDNTLINFIKLKKGATNAAAKAMVNAGLEMDVKEVKEQLFEEYMKDIEGNHAFQDFLKHHGVKSDRILAAALNAHMKSKFKYLKPYSGVKRTLKKLRKMGLKLAIVTDAPRLNAFQRLDAMGLGDYFDFVGGQEDTGKLKPSPFPFKKALKEFNIDAKYVMHVGDWPDKEVLGAKKRQE